MIYKSVISPKPACCAAFSTDTCKVHGKFWSDSNLNEGEHVEPVSSLKSFRKTDLKKGELLADRDCTCQWLLKSVLKII